MSGLLQPLRIPIRALLIALAGVGLAWLWFNDLWWVGLGAVLAAVAVGGVVNAIGLAQLPGQPVRALYLLQSWLLIPLALAALAAAAVVVVTIELTLPDKTPSETKELVGGISAGITTFLTAAFISWTSDEKDSALADHIEEKFKARYTRTGEPKAGAHEFEPESDGDLLVQSPAYGGADGWGWPARLTRARGIAKELADRSSEPVRSGGGSPA